VQKLPCKSPWYKVANNKLLLCENLASLILEKKGVSRLKNHACLYFDRPCGGFFCHKNVALMS